MASKNISKSQGKLKAKTSKLPEARENACDQVAIGFSFESDWWREWCEFSGPITKRSKAKPKGNGFTNILFHEYLRQASHKKRFPTECKQINTLQNIGSCEIY